MQVEKTITLIILDIINIIIHSYGFYLMFLITRRGYKAVQQLVLINLAVTEIIFNVMKLIKNSLFMYIIVGNFSKTVLEVAICIEFIISTSGFYLYIFQRFFVVCDRLLNAMFTYRYHMFWHGNKAKKLLIGAWVTNILISIVIVMLFIFVGDAALIRKQIDVVFKHYVVLFFNTLFLIFTIIAYTIMLWRYLTLKKSVLQLKYQLTLHFRDDSFTSQLQFVAETTTHTSDDPTDDISKIKNDVKFEVSVLKIFRRPTFFICLLLVIAFLVLTAIPALVIIIYIIKTGLTPSEIIYVFSSISGSLNDTADGITYILLEPGVRKRFLFKFPCGKYGKVKRKKKTSRYSVVSQNSDTSDDVLLDPEVRYNPHRMFQLHSPSSSSSTTDSEDGQNMSEFSDRASVIVHADDGFSSSSVELD